MSARKDWGLSFRMGYLFGGEVRFDDSRLDTSGGMVVAFDVDWALGGAWAPMLFVTAGIGYGL